MKRMPSIYLLWLFWCFFHHSQAAALGMSELYDRSQLQYWGARYQRSTTKILDQVIWPALLSREKRSLGGKPIIEFPLWADGAAREHPFAFYVPASGDRIVFPVFSLKFLDDLCTAYAWLQINGFGLETISEYTAILKYGKPPPRGFPPPMRALHIPDNALENRQVDELALGHFVTARTFLLLHEMGHILYGHHALSNAESIRNEQQADRFAATVMQRTPLPPLGILVFFLADAHWAEFPPSGRDTHPLSGARVNALADYIDDPVLARKLRILGAFFDDPDIRAGFVATGKAGDLAALAPRRPGELPARTDRPKQGGHALSFDGIYRGQFVQFNDPQPMRMEMALERQGKQVKGYYSFGLGIGDIAGSVVGKKLYLDWQWSGNYGKAILKGIDASSFTGTWGYREAHSGAGTWTGHRTGE